MAKPRLTLKRVSVIEEGSKPEPTFIDDEFSYGDPIAFEDLQRFLSTGKTNVVVLDLLGKESVIEADAIKGTYETPKKQRRRKPTKFEKALAVFLDEHDIELEEDAVIQLAIVAHSWAVPATRQ